MQAHLLESLNLFVRWAHVIAGIMWVGDSFLFMWLDRQLEPTDRIKGAEGQVAGEMWMVHSGGFYEVVKRKYLAKNELPKSLHWFKWESYTTWWTGACLLVVVYYLGGGAYLVDPTSAPLGVGPTIAIAIGTITVAWFVYDFLAHQAWAKNIRVFGIFGVGSIVGISYGFSRLMTGRAAFIHAGALVGTIMAANVFFRIIPAQRALLAATEAGTTPDISLGVRAKLRSTHNHYLTLPLLFMMLSNHFAATYGNPNAWLVLLALFVTGIATKQLMIEREHPRPWLVGALLASVVAVVVMTAPASEQSETPSGPPVAFSEVRHIVDARCVGCHAAKPTTGGFVAPPLGIIFEQNAMLAALAPRIKVRVVDTKTMPLANLTGMTDAERRVMALWIAQGAKVDP
jgi:uncharacterized membrane protein